MTGIIDPLKILKKYYPENTRIYNLLVDHSKMVTKKALELARQASYLNPDLSFVEEAAMLHDIGIFMTDAPLLGCYGSKQYICHGYLGRELLEKEGLIRHSLVCERHVGVGLSINDIVENNLPLPKRDMLPVSPEEKIICYADKFFSKMTDVLHREKTTVEVRHEMRKYGIAQLNRFIEMGRLFSR